MRAFAVFINASPQRWEAFLNLQSEEPRLAPIQDVRTRWNSTYLMLQRANRLSDSYQRYCAEHQRPEFRLVKSEWRQIEYLLHITKSFYKWTVGLSKIKATTIHDMFRVYNRLFTHFEQAQARLRRKKVPWKKAMLKALEAGSKKLSVYYKAQAHGSLYAIGTILARQHKLEFFKGPEWEGEVDDMDSPWHDIYERSLHNHLENYSKRQPEKQVLMKAKSSSHSTDAMMSLFEKDQPEPPPQPKTGWQEELKGYLDTGMFR